MQGVRDKEFTVCEEENKWNFSARLARLEEIKPLPWGLVWNYYCEQQGLPDDYSFMNDIAKYEQNVLFKRG